MFFLKLSWHLLQVKGIPSILTISANIENYFSKAFFSTYQNVVLFFRSNSTSDQRWCHSYSGHALCSTDMPRAQYDNAGETEKFAHRWCYPSTESRCQKPSIYNQVVDICAESRWKSSLYGQKKTWTVASGGTCQPSVSAANHPCRRLSANGEIFANQHTSHGGCFKWMWKCRRDT